jgi:hypothetical protein
LHEIFPKITSIVACGLSSYPVNPLKNTAFSGIFLLGLALSFDQQAF